LKLHIIRPKQILPLCYHVEERLNKATLENKKRSMKRQLAPLLALLFTGLSAIAEQKTVNIVTVNNLLFDGQTEKSYHRRLKAPPPQILLMMLQHLTTETDR
jgi:hypothetical protein